jgi:hypothetical protein
MPSYPDRRAFLAGLSAIPALTTLGAGPLLAKTEPPRPFSTKVVMSGHSLTDSVPQPLSILVQATGGNASRGMVIDNSSIPGSPMEHRWENDLNLPIDARRDMAKYELLVLTERVPVRATLQYHNTHDVSLRWFKHAWTNGNDGQGAETILYASWISVISGPGNTDKWDFDEKVIPYRERLDLEMGSWQDVADHVNRNRPAGSPPMRVIPGPKVMAAVYDAIAAGTAPGLTDMKELYEDDIHVNAKGGFLIALAHFAVMYRVDPRTIPALRGEAGWPTPEQAEWMKALVWDVVRAYPDSGLG